MKRVLASIVVLMSAAAFAYAADEVSALEGVLKAWQEGTPPEKFQGPMGAKQLLRYEIINSALTRLNGVDTVIVNVLCGFPGVKGKETPRRAVFRVSADARALGGYRMQAFWRRFEDREGKPQMAPPEAHGPLENMEGAMPQELLKELREDKAEWGERAHVLGLLSQMGPGVIPAAEKTLRTGKMRHRVEFTMLAHRVHAANESKIMGEELSNAVIVCTRMVSRIQEDALEATRYREKAGQSGPSGAGKVGGLSIPAEPGDRDSYLRLAARFEEKAAEWRRELDGCAEMLQLCSDYYAESGTDADLAMLAGIVSDKSTLTSVPGWSAEVVRDNELSQVPAVGFSAHHEVNAAGQEQDWLPWGPVWGTLRTVAANRASRAALLDCRDSLEKQFIPLEKKRGGSWEQTALAAEFHRTERVVADRLGSRWETAAGHETPTAECTGEGRERLLAAIRGLAEKPDENEWEKARRLGHEAEIRRSAELQTWHAALSFVAGPAVPMGAEAPKAGTTVPSEAFFMTGPFDFFRETMPATAFLEMHAGAGEAVGRIFLGTVDVPLQAPVAAEIEKGKRRAKLELWFQVDLGKMTTRTLGGFNDTCIPTEFKRLVLRDEATGAVLSEKQEAAAGK